MISPLLRQATLSQPWFYSIHFGGRSLDEFLDHFFSSNSELFVGCLFWVPCSTHPRLYHCTSWLFDLLSEPFMVHKMHGGYSGLVLDCHPKALALPQGGMDGKISVSFRRCGSQGTLEVIRGKSLKGLWNLSLFLYHILRPKATGLVNHRL